MEKFDFLTKELVDEFVTIKPSQQEVKDFKYMGADCARFVTVQGIGFYGLKYKVWSNERKRNTYVVHIGISRQNPNDIVFSRVIGTEVARENAMTNPTITMEVDKKFNRKDFYDMVNIYYNTMKLSIIKTKKEAKRIAAENK